MSVPHEIEQWMPLFIDSGEKFGVDHMLLAAICERESRGGLALRPIGVDGTGDFVPRHGKKFQQDPRYRYVYDGPVAIAGRQETVPFYMPADGLGWGRGIFQIDYAAWAEFIDSGAWKIPAKATDQAARIIAQAMAKFPGDELAVIAAYNCGEWRVARELEEITDTGSDAAKLRALDALTAGGDYVSDVLRRRSKFLGGSVAPVAVAPSPG